MLGQKDCIFRPSKTRSRVALMYGYTVVCAPYGEPKQPEDVPICADIGRPDLGRKFHPVLDEAAPTRVPHRQQRGAGSRPAPSVASVTPPAKNDNHILRVCSFTLLDVTTSRGE